MQTITKQPYILLLAPDAPPKNTTEAIQVHRILAELDKGAAGRLVTLAPQHKSGWGRKDHSLELPLQQFDVQHFHLPLHQFTSRLLMSHRLRWLHQPDATFWLQYLSSQVINTLPRRPDVLYSRAYPMSSALLALRIKRRLHIPWVMHLSDPWADNPYHVPSARSQRQEAACFAAADRIMLTTEGQAEFYRRKYPAYAEKIHVSPNAMPLEIAPPQKSMRPENTPLQIVYAGALYGERSPKTLMEAIALLRAASPEVLQHLQVEVYGNAQPHCQQMLEAAPDVVRYHGPVAFSEAMQVQQGADVLLNIDAAMPSELAKYFLPTKVVDAIALQKPLLAITPDGSETARLCAEGYGWAAAPSDPQKLAAILQELVTNRQQLRASQPKAAPERYQPAQIVQNLLVHFQQIM